MSETIIARPGKHGKRLYISNASWKSTSQDTGKKIYRKWQTVSLKLLKYKTTNLYHQVTNIVRTWKNFKLKTKIKDIQIKRKTWKIAVSRYYRYHSGNFEYGRRQRIISKLTCGEKRSKLIPWSPAYIWGRVSFFYSGGSCATMVAF